MNILVTGGAGYIGSVVVRQLLDKNYNVVVLDSLKWGGNALIDIITNPKLTFIKGDLRNNSDIDKVFENKIDSIIHLAAIVGDPACKKYSEEAHATNWDASVKLFERAEKEGVNRFLFASTCSNYGKMKGTGFVTETSELNPVSLYAELKVKFEDYLLNQNKDSDVIATSLRYSTVYGFSPRIRFDLTVNEFTRDATLGKTQEIWGEQFWRPYCHVEDLARGTILTLESDAEKVKGEVFGIGDTNQNYQKGQIMKEIISIVPNSKATYVAKEDDPRDYRVDFSKIKNTLGFEITKTVPDGIKEIYKIVATGLIEDTHSQEYRNI